MTNTVAVDILGVEFDNLEYMLHARAEDAIAGDLDQITYYAQRGDVIRKFAFRREQECEQWDIVVGGEV
jgi:hypothetical protein